jgi:hypothetical protein
MNLDIIPLVIGFVLGIAANLLTNKVAEKRANAQLRRKYSPIVGEYTAYPFIKDALQQETDRIDYDHPCGDCLITYEKEDILFLHYEERNEDNIWEAIVWMGNPNFGSMVWRYVKLRGRDQPIEHRFGFKRCVFSESQNQKGEKRWFFYLKGEDGFGREALEKKAS